MLIGVNANFFSKPATGIGTVTIEFMRALANLPEGKAHTWIWYYEGVVPVGEWPSNWRFQTVSTWWTRDDVPHRYLWERFALVRAVKHDRCDAFLSLYQSATRLPMSLRHVMLVHDLIPRRFPEYLRNARQRFHYQAIERAIREVSHIIVPSRSTQRDLEHWIAVPQAKITVAPLGVATHFHGLLPLDVRDGILKRHRIKPGYLYHGGGLELRKNTTLLLQAYAKLAQSSEKEKLPPLVISGSVHTENNPLATPVRTLVKELGLSERVRLLDWVPEADLPALYQGALVFIYPSLYEGFGLPVLEAFASGTPVIATAAGSLAELVHDAALVVTTDDVDGLARAIETLVANTDLRATLGRRGKQRSIDYTWPSFASAVVSRLLQ